MERTRIVQILESYRPGEGLEADPEVQEALERAARDPELAKLRDEISAFDEAFGQKLRSIEVPPGLMDQILASAEEQVGASGSSSEQQRKIINWFHPAAFAAAAAIVLLLALSFTFWNPPGDLPAAERTMTAGINPIMQIANSLYENRNPSFKSAEKAELINYLSNHGGAVPGSLPHGFSWDRTFACDVIDVDGVKVSMICFLGPDMKNAMHLFTFRRSDFPGIDIPEHPAFRETKESSCASWANQEDIHVLYSDGGPENLRTLLDI